MSRRRRADGSPVGLVAAMVILPIRFYQRFITPYTPATCKYYPTCSSYAVQALREHGAWKGSWLTVRRLGRCHPWSDGGVDHVPPRRSAAGREPMQEIRSSLGGSSQLPPAHRSIPDRPDVPSQPGRSSRSVRPEHRSTAA